LPRRLPMAVIPHRRSGGPASGAGAIPPATILGGPPHDVALAGATRRINQPPSPGVRLALEASRARIERRADDLLAEAEADLAPAEAAGFADRFARNFDDLAGRALADLPAPLVPALAGDLAGVRRRATGKARDFEALAGSVHLFNTA